MKWDSTTYANVQRRIESLGEGQNFAALTEGEKSMTITMSKGTERMDDEPDMIGAEDEETAPEQGPAEAAAPLDMTPGENGTYGHETAEPEAVTTEQRTPEGLQLSDADRKDLENYEVTRDGFPDEDVQARRRLGIKPDAIVTPAQARELFRAINEIVDGSAQ